LTNRKIRSTILKREVDSVKKTLHTVKKTLHTVKKTLHNMKQSTLAACLKIIVIIAAIIGLLFLIFFIPNEGKVIARVNPEVAYMYTPCLIYVYIMAVPYYLVLYLFYRVFSEIGKNNEFCIENVSNLKNISRLSFIELLLCVIALVVLGYMNILNPGVAILLFLLSFLSITIAMSAKTLSHLTKKAIK